MRWSPGTRIRTVARAVRASWEAKAAATVAAAGVMAACPDGGSPSRPEPPPTSVSGTWVGSATAGSRALPLAVDIAEAGGLVSGRLRLGPPDAASANFDAGALTGTRSGALARWEVEHGAVIAGTFEGERFTGTLSFPAREGYAAATLPIRFGR